MPKVSVIVPTYNLSGLLKDTIDSVLAQIQDDIEIIVVDDGSTDGTCTVVNGIGDSRVRYFYKDNAGNSLEDAERLRKKFHKKYSYLKL